MLENEYQKHIIKRLETEFPECVVLKNDSSYIQGIPDLMILNNNKWAALEIKTGENKKHQPNQEYYIKKFNSMSYSSFIYPENENKIFEELKNYLD